MMQESQRQLEDEVVEDSQVDLASQRRLSNVKAPFDDVSDVLYVDSKIMNFNSFFPGRLLGSNLMVANKSNCEQIIELSVDQLNYTYNIDRLENQFPQLVSDEKDVIPFELQQQKERMVNSEIKHESWFIENPVSKELTKRITLKLGPKAEQDFIIVVRSPNIKRPQNMLSVINIGLLTYKDEEFGVKETFEDFLNQNYENSMKAFLNDRKALATQQKIEILLAGKVNVPKISCLKEMNLGQFDQKIVPIAIKKVPSQPI